SGARAVEEIGAGERAVGKAGARESVGAPEMGVGDRAGTSGGSGDVKVETSVHPSAQPAPYERGTPQRTKTPGHATRRTTLGDYWLAQNSASTEREVGVTYNRSYTRATGGRISSTKRPDVLVEFEKGHFLNDEVLSPSEPIHEKTSEHLKVMRRSKLDLHFE